MRDERETMEKISEKETNVDVFMKHLLGSQLWKAVGDGESNPPPPYNGLATASHSNG